jgi:hypothetical protein
MKKSKVFRIVSTLLIMAILVTACSKKSVNETQDVAWSASTDASTAEQSPVINYTTAKDEMTAEDNIATTEDNGEGGLSNSSALTSESLKVSPQEKIIQCFYLDIETQDFDNLITIIDAKIDNLRGYVESSQIGGKGYYDSNVTRSGNIVARIPSDKVNEFVSNVKEKSNVVNSQKTSENVSLEYIDTQSRIEALEIEQDRLFAILEKADEMKNIITLENRLTEIRYELQSYKSQLRSYDNKVDYSTVTLNIQEVTRITPDTQIKPTFTSRIKNGFSDTIYNISEGFKDFIVWFVVNLPYLLIWGVIIFIVVIIIRKYLRKNNKKKAALEALMNRPNNQMNHDAGQQNKEGQNQEHQNQDHQN